jgi:hypothetical protein
LIQGTFLSSTRLIQGTFLSSTPSDPSYLSVQHTADFEDLVRTIVTMLDPDEQDRLREMEDWCSVYDFLRLKKV